MTSDRTIDLVKRSEAFHRRLQTYYSQLRGKVANERVLLALDYLVEHEARMETELRQYEQHVPENVAARWFNYSPNDELERLLAESDLPTDVTIEQLSTWVAQLNDALVRYYRQFEEASWPEPLREVMERLVEMEREEQKRIVRALQEQVD